MLRGTPSLPVIVLNDWKTGAAKGAVYGFVFMALLLIAGVIVSFPPALGLLVAAGPVGGALIGAATFPLVRAIVESTDSTPPFAARLRREYRRIANVPRGGVAGAAVSFALLFGLPHDDGGARFLFGAGAGLLAYAGVDMGFDLYAFSASAASISAAGASMRSALCWAASSAAPSPGISTPASSRRSPGNSSPISR